MTDRQAIDAAINGANQAAIAATGRELAPWEHAAMRKQLTQDLENSRRRLERMRAAGERFTAGRFTPAI